MSGTEPVHPDIYRYIPRTWKPGQPGEEAPTPTGHFYDHNFSVNPFGARIIDDGMHKNGLFKGRSTLVAMVTTAACSRLRASFSNKNVAKKE